MSDGNMGDSEPVTPEATSNDDLVALLAKRGKQGRAKSTTLLIAVLLVLLGVLIGVPLGRASAPSPEPAITEVVSPGAEQNQAD
jgi:hypothetical protein